MQELKYAGAPGRNVPVLGVAALLVATFLLGHVSVPALGSRKGAAAVLATTPSVQQRQMTTSLAAIDDLAAKLAGKVNLAEKCNARSFGKGWGAHTLCTKQSPVEPCYFYSFGISTDFSFDIDVADTFKCYGFCADPTMKHNSVLHDRVTFHYMGAKGLRKTDNKDWWFYISMPSLRKMLRHDHVAVLKMDCEGCEYSLAADILREDPEFFHHVGQFAVEIHYSQKWVRGKEELYSYATLLELIKEAGLELITAETTKCSQSHQATGLLPELASRKGLRLNEGHCHNYLFARLGV